MSLGDIFGPNPHRPEHPDMRVLVDLVLKQDGKTEDADFDMDAYLATMLDSESVSYMALQRASRMATLMGAEGNVMLIMRLVSLWMDGFMLGYQFHERRGDKPSE